MEIKLYRPRGLNPVFDQREELPLFPFGYPIGPSTLLRIMSLSTTLCPRQAARLPNK